MTFSFFDEADELLFCRSDALSGLWLCHQLAVKAEFPWDEERQIRRGMKLGFVVDDVWQVFEIRRVRNLEPDHVQQVQAEHMAIAELTDCHVAAGNLRDVPPAAALNDVLAGTGWQVGNVTADDASSGDMDTGSAWQAVRDIEQAWNVRISPRVEMGEHGITERFLDIRPAKGEWRGLRLSLDKNADEIGVTYDDTSTLTALFGYGALTDGELLTFESVAWAETEDHPAKPLGQRYIEDPAATAMYGRAGRPRFGYYQNSAITDANQLLERCWAVLQQNAAPDVTIDCTVADLYRLGYADEPMCLGDAALIQVAPIGVSMVQEIRAMQVDLVNPLATRLTIGRCVPGMADIQRELSQLASGGRVGAVSSGRKATSSGNRRGSSAAQATLKEFETQISRNNYQISLRAYQRDLDNVDALVRQARVDITAQGVKISAHDTTLDDHGSRITANEAAITVNADAITSEVTARQDADTALNSRITQTAGEINATVQGKVDKSSVSITEDSITVDSKTFTVDATTIVSKLVGESLTVVGLTAGTTSVTSLSCTGLTVGGTGFGEHSIGITGVGMTGVLGTGDLSLNHGHDVTCSESGGVVTVTVSDARSGSGSASFNMADTAFYRSGIVSAYAAAITGADVTAAYDSTDHTYSAAVTYTDAGGNVYANALGTVTGTEAYDAGRSGVTLSQGSWNLSDVLRVSASNGDFEDVSMPGVNMFAYNWYNGTRRVYCRRAGGSITLADYDVEIPTPSISAKSVTGATYGLSIKVTVSAGGATWTETCTV